MHIVAVAWLYVVLMMAITEPSLVGGLLTLAFYGLLPLGLLLWLTGGWRRLRQRRRTARELAGVVEQPVHPVDRADAKTDQQHLL